MRLYPALSVPLVAITVIAQGTVAPWGQCGGIGYSGPSACGAGYGCTSYKPDVHFVKYHISSYIKDGHNHNYISTADHHTTHNDDVYPRYLQSKPTGTPGYAYLDTNTGAGQFNIKDGQLVYNRGANEDPLYMNVEDPADKTQRKLQTWFNQTKNAYGTFAFQGDTVTWTVADINRPNTAAWLVCEDQELYINTGAYLYQTPPGCVDETIHSYGGSTPDV
ncbi:hypothetical protein VTK73DRAFT_3967 [Phialemonium thermophilum]|uniref:CBM1 domain-containing protein n=1 Tax=Phialemonium thermophilum TaxID=223376 RepID=A0ABR3WWP9_9PEZI